MHFTELPVLGVGLAADVAGALPNFRNFLTGEDTVDYLAFGAHYVQKARIHHFIDDLIRSGLPIVFHPINFNVAVEDREEGEVVARTREIAEYCNAVWTGQDIGVWTYGNQYLGSFLVPPVLDEESIVSVARKTIQLNEAMPCPFLLENPPVGVSIEKMHLLDFMARVCELADCGMVLDVGHLIGYQQATGRAPRDMPIDRFPFERIVEVHVAGLQFSKVGGNVNIIDQHSYPVHELCWDFLREHLHRMTGLKGITLEQEYCRDELVLEHLRKARAITAGLGVFRHAN
jgi:uncharacterized protein (UPF0276 family)